MLDARLAVLSDIHGNLEALEAVLRSAESLGVDGYLCLGDSVGYGAAPTECLDRLKALGDRLLGHVRGNHEDALLTPGSFNELNGTARLAIVWTSRRLGAEDRRFIRDVPGAASLDGVELIHDTPIPSEHTYLRDAAAAASAFRGVRRPLCLVGHTHVPIAFRTSCGEPDAWPAPTEVEAHLLHEGEPFPLLAEHRHILNPGSVGQPRDGDPRASFGLLDLARGLFTLQRIAYDITAAQRRIETSGLPRVLADRLAIGA